MTSKPREHIGRYRIIKVLGKGAMGQVYLAHDPKIDRLVAIKTIIQDANIPDSERDENRQRFLREAQAAGKLLHPVIVTIFDVSEEDGEMYIAMEYIEGESLEKFCEREHLLPWQKVVDYIRQAAEGLDYAHKYQVVHRDIKPANLMVVDNRQIKITDFGLAKNPSTSITQAGMLVGTPNYMAPEQIQGQELDGRSDLFSLGVLFYEMLVAARPFTGKSISTVIYKILHETPQPVNLHFPAIPAAVNAVVIKALAKAPNDRYANGAEFAAALRHLLTERGTEPEPVKPTPPPVSESAATQIGRSIAAAPSLPGRSMGGATGTLPGLPELADSDPRRSVSAAIPPPKKGGAGLIYAGVLVVVLAAVILAWKFMPRRASAPASAAAGRPAITLLPESQPTKGADFSLDGNSGTLIVEDRPGIRHQLIGTLATTGGQCPLRGNREITYDDAAANGGRVVVELKTYKPKLSVNSTPPGAKIFLGDLDSGLHTPAQLDLPDCGTHTIRLELAGYETLSTNASGVDPSPLQLALAAKKGAGTASAPGSTPTTTPASTPASSPMSAANSAASGAQSVPSVPAAPGGTVLVTGGNWLIRVKGSKEKPWMAGQPHDLPAGKYELELAIAEIFAHVLKTVEIKAGDKIEIALPRPATGTVTIKSRPSGTPVRIDGFAAGETPIIQKTIAVGSHMIGVVDPDNPNQLIDKQSTSITAGRDKEVQFVLP